MDPELVHQLENSFLPDEREQFTFALHNLLPKQYHHVVKDLWPLFINYCK